MSTQTRPAWQDASVLERLYWGVGLSSFEMAERLGCSHRTILDWMIKYGIDRRTPKRNSGYNYKKRLPFRTNYSGYEVWRTSQETEGCSQVTVHQLLAISEGADPSKMFSTQEYHVHHKNGIPWDNRPSNIEVLPCSEHMQIHGGGKPLYHRRELIEWIDLHYEMFGLPPRTNELNSWPGPSANVYQREFGSVAQAVREAGYEPLASSQEVEP